MIHCTPKSLFSWGFVLDGDGHRGSLEFGWFCEHGEIVADGVRYDVRKHGLFSGHWTLEREGAEVASARKSSPFTRTFQVEGPMGPLVLRAESAFCRRFLVERAGREIATLSPDHMFRRRATLETSTRYRDFPTICFLFWLTVLTWRRAASGGGGGGG